MAAKKMKLRKRSEASKQESLALQADAWKRSMNDEQLAAIMHNLGPARLLAAAGSGKTRVVTHRIAYLISQGVDPSRILALTFSKKAADEMSKRVEELGIEGCRVGTWHSLCLQILKTDKTEWAEWEIREVPKVELKDVVGWKGMDWKGVDVNRLASFISRCKANLFAPDSDEAKDLASQSFSYTDVSRALQAFHLYNERLAEKCILTFDDFLVFVAEHLADETNRAAWAARWDYVIQDEAQDENQAQRHIARLLAGDHRNYMVVGDVYQAIYSFRGSSPTYLAQFEHEWPGAVTYWLPRNYRSVPAVINAANGIVCKARVEGIDPQNMIAHRTEKGDVRALTSENLDDEAANFVDWISKKVAAGDASYEDFTALFRTNAQSRALEEALIGARIPYVVVGGSSFYERKEVRDVLAYLRIACGVGELEDVKRCINAPFRFLGAKFVDRVTDLVERLEDNGADRATHNWGEIAMTAAQKAGVQYRQKESAREWAGMLANIGRRIALGVKSKPGLIDYDEARPNRILEDIVRETKYLEWIAKEEGEESIEASGVANVREIIRVASRFATCGELLDYVDETITASRRQREDKQAGGDRVLLMNVHRSKGLEWPHVWLAGFNELVIPHVKGDLEEERRLAYVAVTRARDSLVLSYVRTMAMRAGIKDAIPSRFLVDTGVRLDAPDDDDDSLDGEIASGPAGMIGESAALPELPDLPN